MLYKAPQWDVTSEMCYFHDVNNTFLEIAYVHLTPMKHVYECYSNEKTDRS